MPMTMISTPPRKRSSPWQAFSSAFPKRRRKEEAVPHHSASSRYIHHHVEADRVVCGGNGVRQPNVMYTTNGAFQLRLIVVLFAPRVSPPQREGSPPPPPLLLWTIPYLYLTQLSPPPRVWHGCRRHERNTGTARNVSDYAPPAPAEHPPAVHGDNGSCDK